MPQTDLLLNLRKFLAPEIVYGEKAISLTGHHARNMGAARILVVSDPGVKKHGWTGLVEETLEAAGLDYISFTDISPNPRDHEVMTGAEIYHRHGCDFIIAVGGGSPMDCAKGIGVVATNGGTITDYEGIDEVPVPVPPLIFVPTTAGTAADVSQFAIITDSRRSVKIAIVSKMVIPDLALIDPRTTLTMGPELTAATGMDALCHACEAYVSTAASQLTDMAAAEAVRLIFADLRGACLEPGNLELRGNLMMASLMAGLAFSNASLGLVHAMAHALGGAMDLAHGECNALLLEHVARFNYPRAAGKYDRLAQAMGLEPETHRQASRAGLVAEAIAGLRRQVGIDYRLGDLGVSVSDLGRLAEFAHRDPCLATNPREAEISDIETIYRQTL